MSNKYRALRAGVAKTEISTRARPVNDALFAKVLVLDDGRKKAVIIAMDAVAIGGICDIGDDFPDKLRSRIICELSIEGNSILINATHTHTVGPMLCEQDELLEKTIAAVKHAFSDMRNVTAGSGLGRETRIAINRTLRLKNGMHSTIRQAYPCPPDEEVDGLGPVDPDIGILRLDSEGNKPYAVLYTFSCHPLLGVPSKAITANYPGFASKVIEDNTGAMAIFLQGTLGDVTEVLYKDVTRPSDSEPVGRMLGLSTLRALGNIQTGDASINVLTKTVKFPRKLDGPSDIERLKHEQEELLASMRSMSLNFKAFIPLYIRHIMDSTHPADYSYRYMQAQNAGNGDLISLDEQNRANLEKYLHNIHVMEKLCKIQDDIETIEKHYQYNLNSGEDTVSCEIVGIRIGDFVMISCPAEALVEVGQNIKKASAYPHTYVISPSNGYIHYGAPASYYGKGGYEVTECMLAPEWQRIYENTAFDIIGRL